MYILKRYLTRFDQSRFGLHCLKGFALLIQEKVALSFKQMEQLEATPETKESEVILFMVSVSFCYYKCRQVGVPYTGPNLMKRFSRKLIA